MELKRCGSQVTGYEEGRMSKESLRGFASTELKNENVATTPPCAADWVPLDVWRLSDSK